MMRLLPLLLSDSYKQLHVHMNPIGITKLVSNFTPRSFKHLKCDKAVFFGLQYYIKEYLIKLWNEEFFSQDWTSIEAEYKRFHKNFSGISNINIDHWKKLYDLGYMPIHIKALPEGAVVNEKIPFFVITNTHDDFPWLVNFLETQISTSVWDMAVNSTISRMYRQLLNDYADQTCEDRSFVQWQAHDFSQRGRSSQESTLNQAGHLLSFTGTDTIPAVLMLEKYYHSNMDKELIAMSVPATEHAISSANILTDVAKMDDQEIQEVFDPDLDYWVPVGWV